MHDNRVVITGVELIAPNGNDYHSFVQSIQQGATGLGTCSLFDCTGLRGEIVGQIDKEYSSFSSENGKERVDNIVNDVVERLYKSCSLNQDYFKMNREDAMISFATSLSGSEKTTKYASGKRDYPYLSTVPQFIWLLKKASGILNNCFVTMTACASSTAAAGIAYDYICNGKSKIALVGGADPLTRFACVGFHSLKCIDPDYCKPLNNNRNGINIGEAGAFFIFEELNHAIEREANILCEVTGYGIGNDAYHMTTPDITGEGAYRTMAKAIKKATNIDYVNTHGTATSINDDMEIKALNKLFSNGDTTFVSSTKSLTGHCLGAAGAIELAACVATLVEQKLPISSQISDLMEGEGSVKIYDRRCSNTNQKPIERIISNSFAFGGNTATIALQRYMGS